MLSTRVCTVQYSSSGDEAKFTSRQIFVFVTMLQLVMIYDTPAPLCSSSTCAAVVLWLGFSVHSSRPGGGRLGGKGRIR